MSGSSLVQLATRRESRFLVVGAANTLAGIALFAFFHWLLADQVPYVLLLVPTYAVGILLAFTSQRLLVFRVQGHLLRDLGRFASVQLVAMALNAALLSALVEGTPLPVLAAQVVSLGLVVVGSYFAHLLFSFRRKAGE